jgi:uncharacterized membrane protein HdeD (DUF308 family)
MMSTYGPPWKLALIGAVAVVAGIALLRLDWTLAELTAFTAMLFIARGALHMVTTTFEGVTGGLAMLQGAAEIGVGLLLLIWPDPTVFVLVVVVGAAAIVQGTIDATLVVATRADRAGWKSRFAADIAQIGLGVALVLLRNGTVRAVSVTLGALAILGGTVEILTAITRASAEHREGAAKPRPVRVLPRG